MVNMKQTVIFQILADETRLRALVLMAQTGEVCVCELVYALGVSQPKISRHLAAMREAGIVVSRRCAQWVFYKINPDLPDWQHQIVTSAVSGSTDETDFRQDMKRLQTMKNRPERCDAA